MDMVEQIRKIEGKWYVYSLDEIICKGCQLFVHICPKKVFQMKNKVNDKWFVIPEVVNENKCTKCKLCELTCLELAICVDNLD